MYELKIYRGVIICHDNEEWCKIWRGIDLSFQNWHGEFYKFWLEHLEVSKMFTLMCCFWAEYILFELKKYRRVIFHDTEEWYKIWRGIDMSFQNWQEEFDIVWLEHLEVSKIFPLMGSFWAKYILFELKNTEELSSMTLKSDTKFGVESTCCLKIDMRNLTNFDLITWKSQKYSL